MSGRLLTLRDAAERAANSVAWWRKVIRSKAIGVVRLGRSVRVREEDVDRVLREGLRPATAEAARGGRRPSGIRTPPQARG